MRKGETFVDWDGVGDTIARVQHDTGGTTGSVQRQHSLDSDVESRSVESFEHDLGHLLAIGLRVEGRFGKKYRVLFRSNTEFVIEGVMPDLLHVVPVGDDAVLDRVLESQDTTLGLCLITIK